MTTTTSSAMHGLGCSSQQLCSVSSFTGNTHGPLITIPTGNKPVLMAPPLTNQWQEKRLFTPQTINLMLTQFLHRIQLDGIWVIAWKLMIFGVGLRFQGWRSRLPFSVSCFGGSILFTATTATGFTNGSIVGHRFRPYLWLPCFLWLTGQVGTMQNLLNGTRDHGG